MGHGYSVGNLGHGYTDIKGHMAILMENGHVYCDGNEGQRYTEESWDIAILMEIWIWL